MDESATGDHAPNPEAYETFVRLFVAHEIRLRSFLRSLLQRWTDVDEVMQETSIVAWRKFSKFDPATSFMAWTAAIARFEALKCLRKHARERLVFSDDIFDLIADESLAETDTLERHRAALNDCLEKLDPQQKQLLRVAHTPGVKLNELAVQSGRSVQALYKTVQRLRALLLECAERQLRKESAT
jgi:RNA polymerase sigma-70 factor (ECF subfamily)